MNTTATTFPPPPVRVSYRNGMLLDSSDFMDEQGYHRGQLARTLLGLSGFGTIAGLKVSWFQAGSIRPLDGLPRPDEELEIDPGLAVDRFGRLIEVRTAQCLRIANWFAYQATQTPAGIVPFVSGTARSLVADVFLNFADQDQGLRPAFPQPVLDASDAVVPSRTADGFLLTLEPRPCNPNTVLPPVPARRFPALPATRRALLDSIYAAYDPPAPVEYPLSFGTNPSAVFLARISISLTDAPDTKFARNTTGAVTVDDTNRPIVPPSDALLNLLPSA
jgi:hypothetical protein